VGLTASHFATDFYPVQPGDIAFVHAAAGGVGSLPIPPCGRRSCWEPARATQPGSRSAPHSFRAHRPTASPRWRRVRGGRRGDGLKPQARIGRAHQPPSSPVSSARTSSSGGGAELHRLEGIALLGLKRLDEGQRTLRAVAQRQQAKAHELRAATCLARLWGEHSKRREARELLAPVYGWFTEGFDGNA
jgi:hypothetical protein